MGVSVGGVLRQWSAYFRRGRMVREVFGWQPVCGKRRKAQSFTVPHTA